jgi:RHS repeat-associated protein
MTARVVVAAIALVFAMSCFAGTQTRTSAFEYDPASGLLIREVIEPDTSALCLVTTYQYDAYGNKTSTTTRNCNGTATGGLTEAPAPTGDPVFASRTSGTAFAAGSVVIGATTYNWNAGQFATSSTNALNHPETRQFDPRFGSVVSLTGPNLLTTNWTYDSFGRKSSETRADGTITNWFYERCVDLAAGTCPTLGQYRVRVTATGAPTTSTYYDSLAREIRAETQGFDSTLVRKDTQYDSLGRVAQVSRPYYATATPAWTVFTLYDVLGRVTQADEPATSSGQVRTVTAYNSVVTTNPNRWSTTVTVSNAGVGTNMPAGVTQTRTTTKNSQGQVVQVRDTRGSPLDYTYDEFGNLKTTTDALVNVTTLSYDLRGRKTQMVDPDMGTWSYFYDALGQLIRQTDAKSQTATMVYDLLGRMTSRTEPDLISSWTYDSCTKGIGKLCQASANNGYSRTQSYDSLGRPATLSTTIDTAYPITTTYDSSGRADTVTYPTGFAVQNVYNIYGYLWKVQRADVGGSTVFWQANTKSASGQVTSELLGNTLTQTRTLDVLDRLGSIVASGTPGTVHNFGYTYDAIGNVAQRVDSVDGVTENFGYDNLNRLLSASGPGLVTRSFDYNAIGNMIYKSDVGTYAYPASGIGSVRPHAVSSVTGTVNATYTYDANGNLSSGAGRTLTYMSFNLPLTITGTPATYTYTYSPEHERVKLLTQLATGTQTSIYLHPGGKGSLFYEKNIKPDLSLEHKHYVQAGATLVGVYVTKSAYASGDGPQMRYYHRDHLGSIAAISNDVGAIIERLAYEAYGQRRFPNGTADPGGSLFGITTNRGFTAHEHLDELQLIHMNGRVYDPLLGRFMTADLFVQSPNNLQSYNRYSYTLNNPLVYTDPTGYFNLGKALRRLVLPPEVVVVRETINKVDNFVMTHQWAYDLGRFAFSTATMIYPGVSVGSILWDGYYTYRSTGSLNAGIHAASLENSHRFNTAHIFDSVDPFSSDYRFFDSDSRLAQYGRAYSAAVRLSTGVPMRPSRVFDTIHMQPGYAKMDQFVLDHPWLIQVGAFAATQVTSACCYGPWGGGLVVAYFKYEETGSEKEANIAGARQEAEDWSVFGIKLLWK